MSRRKAATKREIIPDPKYKSKKLARFINRVMLDGKKAIAEGIVYGALDLVANKTKKDPMEVFDKAIENASPLVEVKSRRVGGATYQVPMEVSVSRKFALAIRWLVDAARKRAGGFKTMIEKLAAEIMDAADDTEKTGGSSGKGGAIKKREEVHRMAEANKAFSHYRW